MTVDPKAVTEAGAPQGATDLGPGATLGKYRLDHVLGEGGMGVVWAAFDPDLERSVALKLLRSPENVASLRTRLLREARAMARLKHPNVLTVYDVGTDRNRDYIAMELVDGDSLDAWLATRPPEPEILAALLAAGRGLAAAHDAGIVHRDFKPHNVLRSREGHVYVTDFGLARGQIEDGAAVETVPIAVGARELPKGSQPPPDVMYSPLTQTGVLIGTPAYMAPEQFAGRAPDPRTDQFAFCITAWEALTGARPFRGATLDELREAASAGAREGGAQLAPRIRDALVRGLDPDPAKRWPDLHALLKEIEAPAVAAPRKRNRVALALVIAAILALPGGVLLVRSLVRRDPAAGGECASPSEAFASVWGPDKKKQFMAAHHAMMNIGITAILDDTRQRWMRTFSRVCEQAESQQRHERLACLYEVRDEIASEVEELMAPDANLEPGAVASVGVGIAACEH